MESAAALFGNVLYLNNRKLNGKIGESVGRKCFAFLFSLYPLPFLNPSFAVNLLAVCMCGGWFAYAIMSESLWFAHRLSYVINIA